MPTFTGCNSTSVRSADVGDDAYGSKLFYLWRSDIGDRLNGQRGRANARWGFLTPPGGGGKLIWVRAGSSYDSVLLGSELVRAVRQKRRDVRIAFSFEHDYSAMLASRLQGLKGIGIGYGPADRRGIVRRVLTAFAPLGVVHAGIAPRPNLSRALAARKIHSLAVNAEPVADAHADVYFPRSPADARAWQQSGNARAIAPGAAMLSLLVEAQVEPNFRSMVVGSADIALWWIAGIGRDTLPELQREWPRFSAAVPSILFVSLCDALSEPHDRAWLRLSTWQRNTVGAGTIVFVDDMRWLPAIANTANAIHLHRCGDYVFWQTLAAGKPTSVRDRAMVRERVHDDIVLPAYTDIGQVLYAWRTIVNDRFGARQRGDALRRVFWQERRRAATVSETLLQRIYDW